MAVRPNSQEWTKYYCVEDGTGARALHARFVSHRCPPHTHDYCVVGLVESGAQSYSYRGSRHITPAGQVFVVNPDETHTGEAAAPSGYVYRTLCLGADFVGRVLDDLGMPSRFPLLKGAVLRDPQLAGLLSRFHTRLALQASKLEQKSLLLEALALLFMRYADVPGTVPRAGREGAVVTRARDYIESHFDHDISLTKLAEVGFFESLPLCTGV